MDGYTIALESCFNIYNGDAIAREMSNHLGFEMVTTKLHNKCRTKALLLFRLTDSSEHTVNLGYQIHGLGLSDHSRPSSKSVVPSISWSSDYLMACWFKLPRQYFVRCGYVIFL